MEEISLEKTKPSKSKSKTTTKEKSRKKLEDGTKKKKKKEKKKDAVFVDRQQELAKEQAETLRQNASRLSEPPELATPEGAANSRALRLRLDLNLDADIRLKATIRGSIKLTLL